MDNTELHYLTYDPDAILAEMMAAYVEAGGGLLYPGDEKEMLLQAILQIMVQAFAGIDNALRMATLRYAVRDYLKVIGEDRNCPYIEATKASATVSITFKSTGTAQTIAAGEALTEDGVTLYTLDEAVEDTGEARTVTAAITCSKAGAAGNGLLSGTQMQFLVQHEGVESVVCAEDAAGGQDDEDWENYRERIRTKGLMSVTTGTAENYRSAAMAVSSVILDARALALSDLSVCVYLLLSDDTGAAAIIAAVEAALSATDTRPLTDQVSVALATPVSYSLVVEYGVPEGTSIESAVAAAVDEYTQWQNERIGRPFDPDKLKALLYQAGATRVVFGSGSRFDGGSTIEYTEIAPSEVCSGTVTTAVMGA